MIRRNCPLCGSDHHAPHLTAPDTVFGFPGTFHVVRCQSCGMLFTNPQVAPEDLPAFYPDHYSAHALDRAPARVKRSHRRNPWDNLPDIPNKRLLDVGCGNGAYLLRQQQKGWTVFGIDPLPNAVNSATARGLNVVQGVIPGARLPQSRFDVITMLGVLDHVPNPLHTLTALRQLLAPDGRLIISVPNANSAAAKLLGPQWPAWDLPRHQNHFTPQTLTRILTRAGFRASKLAGRRRTSRWQHGARLRAASTGLIRWKTLARSRALCSLLAALLARHLRADEIIAFAAL